MSNVAPARVFVIQDERSVMDGDGDGGGGGMGWKVHMCAKKLDTKEELNS